MFVVFWLDVFKNTNHQRTSGDFATIVSFARKEKQNTQEKKKPKRTNTIKKKNNKTIYDYVYINMISQISRLIIKKNGKKIKNIHI